MFTNEASLSLTYTHTHARGVQKEFAQLFPGLPMDYHVPLYDLYAQLLREVSEKSKDEFEQIVEEERIESRLNAIDDACKQRGIDQMKSVEVIAREIIGEQVIQIGRAHV